MAQALLKVFGFLVSRGTHLKTGRQPETIRVCSDTQANARRQLALYLASTFSGEECRIHTGGVLVCDNVINNEG